MSSLSSKSNHDQLLEKLNPVVDYMTAYRIHHFVLAGKDGTCSRYLLGNLDDLAAMLEDMANKNPDVKKLIKTVAEKL
jgi:hypothetical protein